MQFDMRFRQEGARTRAFTRVEVIVIIAVLAMLSTLLLPSLRRARDRSCVAKCLSNLRDIGEAIHQYMEDHGGTYPPDSGKNWRSFRFGGGDPSPEFAQRFDIEKATERPL